MKSVDLFSELNVEEEAILAGGEGGRPSSTSIRANIDIAQVNEITTRGGRGTTATGSNSVEIKF
jgi:hypothetical protein